MNDELKKEFFIRIGSKLDDYVSSIQEEWNCIGEDDIDSELLWDWIQAHFVSRAEVEGLMKKQQETTFNEARRFFEIVLEQIPQNKLIRSLSQDVQNAVLLFQESVLEGFDQYIKESK